MPDRILTTFTAHNSITRRSSGLRDTVSYADATLTLAQIEDLRRRFELPQPKLKPYVRELDKERTW